MNAVDTAGVTRLVSEDLADYDSLSIVNPFA
jgi:hypothetical protein